MGPDMNQTPQETGHSGAPPSSTPIEPPATSEAPVENEVTLEGSQLPAKLRQLARDFEDVTLTAATEGGEAVGRVASRAASSARRVIASGLDRVGSLSQEQQGFVAKVTEMVPFIGPNKKYAEARRKYILSEDLKDKGFPEEAERALMDARKECLRSLVDLGIDIAVLGSGRIVPGIARLAKGTLAPLYAGRVARVLGAVNIDPVDVLAEQVAKSSRGSAVADFLLQLIKSDTSPQDLASRSEEIRENIEDLVVDPPAESSAADRQSAEHREVRSEPRVDQGPVEPTPPTDEEDPARGTLFETDRGG